MTLLVHDGAEKSEKRVNICTLLSSTTITNDTTTNVGHIQRYYNFGITSVVVATAAATASFDW